jgi:NAD(P)H-hydrate epimerase
MAPNVSLVRDVPPLPPRPRDAHKGTFGTVVVVAGSRGMSGAAVLCGLGALRGGSGIVRLVVPQGIQPTVAAANPCYLTDGVAEDAAGRLGAAARQRLLEQVAGADAAVVGPGLGQSADLAALLAAVLDQTPTPLVLDADALNNLRDRGDRLGHRKGAVIITPHPGEFARLTGSDIATVQADRQGHAVRYAVQAGVTVVLKGHGSIVTDGRLLYVNGTGNPGMATGGTGDVLAGLTAALLGQGLEAFPAARLGVYLHGLAGDLAADDLGETSLIAADLPNYLPHAFLAHARLGTP